MVCLHKPPTQLPLQIHVICSSSFHTRVMQRCVLLLLLQFDAPPVEGDENDVAGAVSYTGRGLLGTLIDMANYKCPVTLIQGSPMPGQQP